MPPIDTDKFLLKNPCRHRNEADNCLLCGTKGMSMTPLNQPERTPTPVYEPTFCKRHKCTTPCGSCDLEAEVEAMRWRSESLNSIQLAAINERSAAIWKAVAEKEKATRWPGGKCDHGHYLANDYCNVCSIALVEPGYDRERFRSAINKGLKGARRIFGEAPKPEVPTNENIPIDNYKTEREKNFEEIKNLVDLEIWKASREYGDQMNEKFASYIARSVAGRFITDLIDDETILTDISWEFMPTDFRAKAEALFERVGGLDGLYRISKSHHKKDTADAGLAKKIIIEYGERVSRFSSFDAVDESGKEADTSPIEIHIHERAAQNAGRAPELTTLIAQNRPELSALVRSWHGVKRLVGEAVLNGATTREIPGVPQKTAQRVRKVVLEEFRKRLTIKAL